MLEYMRALGYHKYSYYVNFFVIRRDIVDKVEKRRAFLINFAFTAVLLALAFVGLKYFFWVAAPFLFSFFFAVLLQKPLRFLDKKTKHKAHGLLSVVLVILSICVIIVPLSFLKSKLTV